MNRKDFLDKREKIKDKRQKIKDKRQKIKDKRQKTMSCPDIYLMFRFFDLWSSV
jgi:hypothetical protein